MKAAMTATTSPPAVEAATVRRTQVVDIARSVPLGVLIPLETSLLLTVAIKHFDAPALVKGLIAAAPGFGLLASPFVTAIARRGARPVMLLAATLSLLGAVGFMVATVGPLAAFVLGSAVGVAVTSAAVPLLTVTYDRNFSPLDRGKRVGRGLVTRVAVQATVGLAFGGYLTRHPDRWRLVTVAGVVASIVMVVCNRAMPSASLDRVDGMRTNPWPHWHLLAEDRKLRLTLIAWMFMGFGNLMLLPLRVEYLAKSRYGIEASPRKIALLTITIPAIVRLVTLPVFGRIFDRVSFFAARIVVNLFFATYIAAFFTGTSTTGLVIGAVLFGIGSAGGDLMWTLWVTKFAPPGRVADYMGLHTFSTGIRAVAAPILGFLVIEKMSLVAVAIMASALIVMSSAMLVPEALADRQVAPAS
jgi:MFS family permease